MPRFFTVGGSVFEQVGRQTIERDPYKLHDQSEAWAREALEHEQHGRHALARVFARDSRDVMIVIQCWIDYRRAATGRDPFEGRAA